MSNKLSSKINLLIKALEINKNIIYCLDRKQYYSSILDKRCTKYILHRDLEELDERGKRKKEKQEFNRQLDLLLFLVSQLNAKDGDVS